MSKLFEALKRTSEVNKEILAVVEADQPAAGPEVRLEPAPEPAAAQPASGPAAALDEPLTAAPASHLQEPQYRVEHLRLSASTPTLPFDGAESRASAQYRLIRTRILHHPGEPKILLVSSPAPGTEKQSRPSIWQPRSR